jgi:hypothetical protein
MFWRRCNSCCVGFKFWVDILAPWRRKEEYPSSLSLSLCVCVCVSLSLFWCSYVIPRKWEIGRQIVVAREDLHPTALQNPNKRWLHAGPRSCVTSQALEVRLLPFLCFFFLVLFPYPAFVIIRPTYIQSSTMWRNLKVLGTRRFGIRVQSFLGWWWWRRWFLPSSETPTDCSCGH